MISSRQMAAARALLGWTQEQLANEAKTSPSTINKFEKGDSISFDKLNDARSALENNGIKFLGRDGVLRHSGSVKTYSGSVGGDLFYDDLISTVKEKGGIVAATFDTQESLAHCLGATSSFHDGRLERVSKFAQVKCLLSNARDSAMQIPLFQFRAIARNSAHPFFSIIYGNKIAIISADGTEFTYVIMDSVARAKKNLTIFEEDWEDALPFAALPNTRQLMAV